MKSKNRILKRLTVGFGLSIAIVWGIFISCEKEDIFPSGQVKDLNIDRDGSPDGTVSKGEICSPIITKALLIDGTTKVGFVKIYNDARFLYVDAFADGEFGFGEARLYTGTKDDAPRGRLGRLNYLAFNNVKYALPRQYVKLVRFKIQLSEVNTNIFMAMMIQVNPEAGSEDVRQAWIVDGGGDGKSDLFQFQEIKCRIDKPESTPADIDR